MAFGFISRTLRKIRVLHWIGWDTILTVFIFYRTRSISREIEKIRKPAHRPFVKLLALSRNRKRRSEFRRRAKRSTKNQANQPSWSVEESSSFHLIRPAILEIHYFKMRCLLIQNLHWGVFIYQKFSEHTHTLTHQKKMCQEPFLRLLPK